MVEHKKKVLLIYPGQKVSLPRSPFPCMVLASYIRERGYNVEILDTRIDDFTKVDFNKYFVVSISSMSGSMLAAALDVCKHIKKYYPDIPIIVGGHHATFTPKQTVKSKYIDYVIRGEGEETFFELLEHISKSLPLDSVKGISFKSDGNIISTPDREYLDMEKLPFPAYDLIKMEKYADFVETFTYESSRGCPYRCKFCYNLLFHKRQWRCKSVKKTLDELEIIYKKYKPLRIDFVEDNFFIDKKRLLDICGGIINRGLKFKWTAFARANTLSQMTDEEIEIVKKSGCDYLAIGAESGSDRVLKLIQKDITRDMIVSSVKICSKHDIMPVLSFVIGTPYERKEDLYQTLDLYDKLHEITKKVEINGLFIFTPYPGSVIFNEVVKMGYKPKDSLEEWAKWKFGSMRNMIWHKKSYFKKLRIISIIARYKYFDHRISYYSETWKKKKLGRFSLFLYKILNPLFRVDANYRWKKRKFGFAYEWLAWDFVKRKVLSQT